MSCPIGKQLTELHLRDRVTVTIGDTQYVGEVIDKDRWKCELIAGIMESGGVVVDIKLDNEYIEQHDLPGSQLKIKATEDVPRSWENPTATFYEPDTEESYAVSSEIVELNPK